MVIIPNYLLQIFRKKVSLPNPFVKSITIVFFQVYLGSHGNFGEDGIEIKADRAIGRDDYGQPQFRKRSNMRQPRAHSIGKSIF